MNESPELGTGAVRMYGDFWVFAVERRPAGVDQFTTLAGVVANFRIRQKQPPRFKKLPDGTRPTCSRSVFLDKQ